MRSQSPSAQSQQPNPSSLGYLLKLEGDGYPGVGEREASQPEPAVLFTVPFLVVSCDPQVPFMSGVNQMMLAPICVVGTPPPPLPSFRSFILLHEILKML